MTRKGIKEFCLVLRKKGQPDTLIYKLASSKNGECVSYLSFYVWKNAESNTNASQQSIMIYFGQKLIYTFFSGTGQFEKIKYDSCWMHSVHDMTWNAFARGRIQILEGTLDMIREEFILQYRGSKLAQKHYWRVAPQLFPINSTCKQDSCQGHTYPAWHWQRTQDQFDSTFCRRHHEPISSMTMDLHQGSP